LTASFEQPPPARQVIMPRSVKGMHLASWKLFTSKSPICIGV
jgi:hypothetical protein